MLPVHHIRRQQHCIARVFPWVFSVAAEDIQNEAPASVETYLVVKWKNIFFCKEKKQSFLLKFHQKCTVKQPRQSEKVFFAFHFNFTWVIFIQSLAWISPFSIDVLYQTGGKVMIDWGFFSFPPASIYRFGDETKNNALRPSFNPRMTHVHACVSGCWSLVRDGSDVLPIPTQLQENVPNGKSVCKLRMCSCFWFYI